MERQRYVTVKTGAKILDRPAYVMLERSMALDASQLTNRRIRVKRQPRISMAPGALSSLGLGTGMVDRSNLATVAVETGGGPVLANR